MKKFLLLLFTWWNGTTMSTLVYTWLRGNKVGQDALGNVYFEGDGGRRWVRYSGVADASSIPPGWHGWMHHRTDVKPDDEGYQPQAWQKDHLPNQTGSPDAYLPKGSLAHPGNRARVGGDYDAWTPDNHNGNN